MNDLVVIARKSPWIVGAVSLCMIAAAVSFTVFSVHNGFDTSSRPWMAKRLWLWITAAYVACPLLVIFVLTHFLILVRYGFVCIALKGDRLVVAALPVRDVPFSSLKSVETKGGMLLLVLDRGKPIDVGRLGFIGGTQAVIERLNQLKPGPALQP